MARLTSIGANLIAAAVGSGPELEITKFVFANIPGLVHTDPEPVDEPIPAPGNIVFQRAPTAAGVIDENRVTYSQMLLTDIGDFSFNWIGLVYTHPVDGDQLVMFAYVPLTQKVKTAGATAGNVLTRNMVIEHLGIANAVPVVVSAESWMFDFTDEFTSLVTAVVDLTARVSALEERTINKFVYNPVGHTCVGLAQRETVVFDLGQSEAVTLDAATLIKGDIIEIQKLAAEGRIDIVGTVNIVLPNGVSELNHWLPAGKTGVLIFECVAVNQLRYAGGF